jgi:hypothetical protein
MSRVAGFGSSVGFLLSGFGFGGAVLEAEAVIAGLYDMAMMGKAVEQCCGHLGIAEHSITTTAALAGS